MQGFEECADRCILDEQGEVAGKGARGHPAALARKGYRSGMFWLRGFQQHTVILAVPWSRQQARNPEELVALAHKQLGRARDQEESGPLRIPMPA